MADTISWIATAATIVAAFMTAANLGSKITGYGFAVFLIGSISWLTVGILTEQPALTWTNVVLTLLNVFGVWRWLGRQASVEKGGRVASERSERTPGEALFPVSMLTRGPVEYRGQQVGTCVDAMAGCSTGRLAYVVVSQGGVAGVGETLRKVEWNIAQASDDKLIIELHGRRLDELEELPKDNWPTR